MRDGREARVAVVGAGSWGTTVASLAASNAPTVLWARRADAAAEVVERHTNEDYLPGESLEESLEATDSLADAVGEADVLVMAVPSHGFREVLEETREHLRPWVPVVSLTKGLEQETKLPMTEVIDQVLPGHPAGVLTGPNIAAEVIGGYAAAAVLAMPDAHVSRALQGILGTTLFRVYTSTDVAGAAIAGALKNVIAIATGMGEGLGAGDNTRAAVITRGLRELTRLGCAMGGEAQTFGGLAGMGDLIVTCMSPHSRNRRVGEELAKGKTVDEITGEMNQVAEGIRASRVVRELAADHGVEMPIAAEVYSVVHEGKAPAEAFRGLLRTSPTTELAPG